MLEHWQRMEFTATLKVEIAMYTPLNNHNPWFELHVIWTYIAGIIWMDCVVLNLNNDSGALAEEFILWFCFLQHRFLYGQKRKHLCFCLRCMWLLSFKNYIPKREFLIWNTNWVLGLGATGVNYQQGFQHPKVQKSGTNRQNKECKGEFSCID